MKTCNNLLEKATGENMNPKEIADALKISESELKQVLLAIGIDELLNRASRYDSHQF